MRIAQAFDYNGPATSPSYILINLTTNGTPGGGSDHDSLWVDDIEMIYNQLVTIAPVASQNLVENEAGTVLSATELPTAASSREWKYSTTSGSGYVSFATPETGVNYTPNFVTAGTYYIVCESTIGNVVVTSNEVTVNVTAFTTTVSPATTQNLVENQNGSVLTVTETPTPDSREWKYSTTSGSGYASFTTPETGVNYTPNFATAGTYYIVCESTIDNITVISNEVEVVVTKDLAVLDQTASNVLVYGKDQMVMVDLSTSNLEKPEIHIYDMQGRLVKASKLASQTINSVLVNVPEGIYLVKLTDGSNTTQQKVYLR